MTVILITHHMKLEAISADRVIVMTDGTIWPTASQRRFFEQVELLKSAGLTVPRPPSFYMNSTRLERRCRYRRFLWRNAPKSRKAGFAVEWEETILTPILQTVALTHTYGGGTRFSATQYKI